MQFDDLRSVCPIHFHRLFLISSSAGSWIVLSYRRLLLMVSGQWMLSILRRQLFINTCTFLIVVVVVLQVSAPYSRTALTLVLKILTLILVESRFEFHMFFNCRNAVLALPILAFTSASEPPCSSMMLPRQVNMTCISGLIISDSQQDTTDEEHDDKKFVSEETPGNISADILTKQWDKTEPEDNHEHGGLVTKILQTKKEYENVNTMNKECLKVQLRPVVFIIFICAYYPTQRVLWFPLFCFPSGFQVSACLVMQFDDLRNVCPIHFHRLFLISSSAGSWFVLSHRRLLLMVSGQWMLSILRRQLFLNTCTFMMVVVVVLQVSAPYIRTTLTLVLKILTLILVESCFEFHMFFNCRNAFLALPILFFTSASEPPCSSMMLPSGLNEAAKEREKALFKKEINRLCDSLQTLSRSAIPLSKLMDFVQEDLETMQQEYERWKTENHILKSQLKQQEK
ncbi:unnamed protein product [Schistosoma margrebowiei]|uniref:Uncharacterized protein n=1 Tax=Schistosoma margrebowiei TaxID=48269 RepID=A0A183LJS8_9TREM|nr:unnamed protein product [Schistosoma margrebowiei]